MATRHYRQAQEALKRPRSPSLDGSLTWASSSNDFEVSAAAQTQSIILDAFAAAESLPDDPLAAADRLLPCLQAMAAMQESPSEEVKARLRPIYDTLQVLLLRSGEASGQNAKLARVIELLRPFSASCAAQHSSSISARPLLWLL